ncbi:cadherin domain protein, partial [Teladorsagia circumcincta]
MDTPLNRELKDHYDFLVKATCRQKEAGNLEATAKVRLTITDRNDAMPIFTLEADQYEATISDQTAPFTDVIRVEASDADEGINGQIYYSLLNRSADFTVDPVSGWIRTLRHLRSGVYQLKVRSEDRTSRLFYNDPDQIQPAWSKDVVIEVGEPHSIVFDDAAATFHVNESAPLGYVIGKVSASAMYKQDEKNIRLFIFYMHFLPRYSLEMRDNATVPFEVSEKTGVLR